jgi:hypothetical protein
MPTVLRDAGYRFFFFSADRAESVHIHVAKGDGYAKFWLNPVVLARARNFAGHELTEIARLVTKHRGFLAEKWREHFSSAG